MFKRGCFQGLDISTDGRRDKTKRLLGKDMMRKYKALACSTPRGKMVNYNISTAEAARELQLYCRGVRPVGVLLFRCLYQERACCLNEEFLYFKTQGYNLIWTHTGSKNTSVVTVTNHHVLQSQGKPSSLFIGQHGTPTSYLVSHSFQLSFPVMIMPFQRRTTLEVH